MKKKAFGWLTIRGARPGVSGVFSRKQSPFFFFVPQSRRDHGRARAKSTRATDATNGRIVARNNGVHSGACQRSQRVTLSARPSPG